MLHPSMYAGWEGLDLQERQELLEIWEALREAENKVNTLRLQKRQLLTRGRVRLLRRAESDREIGDELAWGYVPD